MCVRLNDLISFAYYTLCYDFNDLESDLIEVLQLAVVRSGINSIRLEDGEVYLSEHDLVDVVEYLSNKVEAILEELREKEEEEIL